MNLSAGATRRWAGSAAAVSCSIVLVLMLAACSQGDGTPSRSVPSSAISSTGPSAPLVAEGLGDIVFNRDLALHTINADGTGERQIHEAWDGIGLSKDGTTFFSPSVAPDGKHVDLYAYTSMVLALAQQQDQEIKELRAKVDELERRLPPAKKPK